ncbi:uncharacterized protein N7469_002320 [Penicillium citrinum]|uniref:Uncharacterized protein n=1 Tax=Penicillium citrinum TaxID=5077 RepID=A0A9W9TV95_PENCI|nr:uncharacterized protein N7469_002320 [Penicillium citrinum]KAJ5240729.1 hypothetical protein N7469_002320 [Penicillium citrinum]
MALLDLPLELLLALASCLEQPSDLLSLVLLNKHSSRIFIPFLYSFNVRFQDSSALMWASRHGQINLIEQLLEEYGANPNTVDAKLRTPLFYAARIKSYQIVRALIRNGADANWQDQNRQTPLLFCLERKYLSIARDILAYFDPAVSIRDGKGRNAIWYAVAHGDIALVHALLTSGNDISTGDYKGLCPFNLAIFKQDTVVLTVLLDYAKSNCSTESWNWPHTTEHPLCAAIRYGSKECLELLISYGASVSVRNRKGRTLLHQATIHGHCDIVQMLLGYAEISLRATDTKGATALHLAARYGHTAIAKTLLASSDIEVDSRDRDGATPLCTAIRGNHQSVALQILAKGADINRYCRRRETALHHAVKNGNILLVCVLLDMEVLDPNIRDRCGWAPITYAALSGSLRLLEVLLARPDIALNDVDINMTVWNKSPLFIAIEYGHIEVAKLLIGHSNRLDVNSATFLGDTALSVAAVNGHLDIVELLLQNEKLNCMAQNAFGETALQLAAREGHEAIVRCLCRDIRLRDLEGLKDAIKYAANIRLKFFLQGQYDICTKE